MQSTAAHLAVLSVLLLPSLTARAGKAQLHWVEADFRTQVSGMRPHALKLSTNVPAAWVADTAAASTVRFGALALGPETGGTSLAVAVEFTGSSPITLRVDGNANGSLADDAAAAWRSRTFTNRDGRTSVSYDTAYTVAIPLPGGARPGQIGFYFSGSAAEVGAIFHYSDFGYTGSVEIAGRTLPIAIDDAGGRGEFKISSNLLQTPIAGIGLSDAAGGAGRRKTFPASRPFEVEGSWWVITNLTADGALEIVATDKPVAPRREEGPNLEAGQKAPAFTAKRLDGGTVQFPSDYTGRVVLVDFWATWCGPCVAEIPNVLAAYGAYHDKGLDVLGISLDREEDEEKLAGFVKKHSLPWPQVFDRSGGKNDVAQRYGIRSIPHMILVDGDTGVILANKTIRGPALAPAIEKALEARKTPARP